MPPPRPRGGGGDGGDGGDPPARPRGGDGGSAESVAELQGSTHDAIIQGRPGGQQGAPGNGPGSGGSGTPADRAARLEDLARDPAHGGNITPNSRQEATIGLDLEDSGQLPGPIRRDPTGGAEFVDANGQDWDVKGFNSNFPPNRGGYNLNSSMQKIHESIRDGENVIIDTSKMTPQAVQELRTAVEANDSWAGKVLWWP